MSEAKKPHARLDLTGLNCPLPVLHARKFMQKVSAGMVVEIRATDPLSVKDFDAFCRKSNNDLLDHREDAGIFTINIRKGV
jgi:tRNA 2-thiouridine synthesizing protein A